MFTGFRGVTGFFIGIIRFLIGCIGTIGFYYVLIGYMGFRGSRVQIQRPKADSLWPCSQESPRNAKVAASCRIRELCK